ncbi:MAG TPA: PrgI family protein [Candidatus Saccharimonadales bacterium]|nr:PrgI family protein [Candidatus Saccharimonadales bacterium]
MATYKVIQDIEAEDKLVGPLTLRQFIYACIAAVCGYLSFISVAKGFPFFLIVTLPPMIFTGFFAFPWGRDQPTELWALAKIRFYFKPRRRIWDQTGARDLVHITAPKQIERVYTNGLSENEVQSRLTALASTLDTRGWATKNSNVNLSTGNPAAAVVVSSSDRLIGPAAEPQEVSDITAGDDMLDEANNARAQQLDQMITASSQTRRKRLVERLHLAGKAGAGAADQPAPPPVPAGTGAMPQLPPPADYWFLNKPVDMPAAATPTATPMVAAASAASLAGAAPVAAPAIPVAATPTADEEALAEQLRQQHEKAKQVANFEHMKVIQPLEVQQVQAQAAAAQQAARPAPVTPSWRPDTIGLARNDDLNIATIARIANGQDRQSSDEVVISLHDHAS